MIDALEILQTTLDALLVPNKIYSYWQRKTDAKGQNPAEYIVYTQEGESDTFFADDTPCLNSEGFVVRYYYSSALMESAEGRSKIRTRTKSIISTLKTAGFSVPNGAFDAGDIDGTGYNATIIECEYEQVI